MPSKKNLFILVLGFAAGAASAADLHTGAGSAPAPAVASVQPVYTPTMRKLMDSAQQLRASIQALAQKPPGAERDTAMDEARQALLRTQQAMLDLPPDLRSSGTTASTAGYDASVKTLMHAADALRDSVQAMARQPAGPGRNQAIRDANRALLDTQVAMGNAYDATATPSSHRAAMGAGAIQCTQLRDMQACRHQR